MVVRLSKTAYYILVLGSIALGLNGCGGGGGNNRESNEGPPPLEGAAGGKPVDLATTGEVTGTVTLAGTPPRMRRINMQGEPSCAREHTAPVYSQQVVTGDGRGLANVVVYVLKGLGDYSFPSATAPVKLDQKGCQYVPHVVALRTGQRLEITNSDPVTHNIHPIPQINPEWNESQPPDSAPIEKTFPQPEVGIPVKCNVHPWMRAYLAILPDPYFQVTAKDGTFDLKGLPPGTYTLAAWQEFYGTLEQTVTIGPKQSKSIMFSFHANASAPAGD